MAVETRPVKAIKWNPKKALLTRGGTIVFISDGKGLFTKYGPIQGNGLRFERNLAKAIGIPQDGLHAYLKGREVHGINVHGLLMSTDRDRRAAAQARR